MKSLKSFGKKVSILSALACIGSSAFAADISANLMLRGTLFNMEKTKYNDTTKDNTTDMTWLSNNAVTQKDDPGDGLTIDVDAGVAGAHLALWYDSASADEDKWSAYFRRSYAWFKPVDSLKLRLGYVGNDSFFKEKIDEWKVGSPFAVKERDWTKHPAYINCNDVEGWGFGVEYQPMESLKLNAGISPSGSKKGDSITNLDGKNAHFSAFGGGAVYYLNDQIELQASYRTGGTSGSGEHYSWQVVRLGASYTMDNFWGFVQPVLGIDYNTTDEKYEANGLCLDLYGEYSIGALKLMLHTPVTFRWTGEDDDSSYMEMNLLAKYNLGTIKNMDDFSPYIKVGSNQDDATWGKTEARAWLLDDHFGNSFNLSVTPGVNFKVGAAEIDVGVKYDYYSDIHKKIYQKDYTVSVPFKCEIAF